jgi:hypothetical protein
MSTPTVEGSPSPHSELPNLLAQCNTIISRLRDWCQVHAHTTPREPLTHLLCCHLDSLTRDYVDYQAAVAGYIALGEQGAVTAGDEATLKSLSVAFKVRLLQTLDLQSFYCKVFDQDRERHGQYAELNARFASDHILGGHGVRGRAFYNEDKLERIGLELVRLIQSSEFDVRRTTSAAAPVDTFTKLR